MKHIFLLKQATEDTLAKVPLAQRPFFRQFNTIGMLPFNLSIIKMIPGVQGSFIGDAIDKSLEYTVGLIPGVRDMYGVKNPLAAPKLNNAQYLAAMRNKDPTIATMYLRDMTRAGKGAISSLNQKIQGSNAVTAYLGHQMPIGKFDRNNPLFKEWDKFSNTEEGNYMRDQGIIPGLVEREQYNNLKSRLSSSDQKRLSSIEKDRFSSFARGSGPGADFGGRYNQ